MRNALRKLKMLMCSIVSIFFFQKSKTNIESKCNTAERNVEGYIVSSKFHKKRKIIPEFFPTMVGPGDKIICGIALHLGIHFVPQNHSF